MNPLRLSDRISPERVLSTSYETLLQDERELHRPLDPAATELFASTAG